MDASRKIAEIIKKQTKLDVANILETPPEPGLGDVALPCFKLAGILKKEPNKIAEELKGRIKSSLIREVKVAGGYLNFYLNRAYIIKSALTEKRMLRKKNKPIVIEFPSPNTNKPLHLGHLRNMGLGESAARILEFQGYRVKRVNLNNDRGIHVCKSMLAYKMFGMNKMPDKKSDHFVGDFYVMFAKEAEKNPECENEAQEMLRKWEKKDKETLELWKRMNAWALKGFEETYKRFGLKKFDKTYFESQTYEKGREMVMEGLKKGLFEKDETGAVYAELGKELGKKILIRADGTTVYITQDLYLAVLKYKDFKFHKSIYVVASEQNYHFKVLFELLKRLGYKFGCYHLSYGMVLLPEGRMKSREGKVVDADDLMDDLKRELLKLHKLNNRTAEKIMLAAIKYYLLRFAVNNDIMFIPEKSISFEGETGPYLQYSLIRAKRKLGNYRKPGKAKFEMLDKPEEFMLAKRLSGFDGVVEKSAETYSPNLIANYAYGLAEEFNLFYEKCPVLKAEKEIKEARLLLVSKFYQTLKTALYLLGIEEVERM